MQKACKKMYIPRSQQEHKAYREQKRFNANVSLIDFKILKDKNQFQLGDPIFCNGCIASLNSYSKIQDAEDNKKLWICEFCQEKNYIMIEKEEIPQSNDIVYMLQSNQQLIKENKDTENSIIFCIDNSGSMAVTSEIKGQIKLKRKTISKEEIQSLKQFMSKQELQQYLNMMNQANEKYISRKNCVLAAIESQLEEYKIFFPNQKIGLVVFGDEITVIGDGFQQEVIIAGDKLKSFDDCQKLFDSHLKIPVNESYEKLLQKFENLSEKGKTALGPALALSLGITSKSKPGSVIILCTDGLANVGIGALDNQEDLEKAEEFYEMIGKLANEKGIVIQTITMKGEQCNIAALGKLAEITQGRITRVNPEKIHEDFSQAMNEEVLATNLVLKVLLHKGLEFKQSIIDDSIKIQDQIFQREIGNVTYKTQVSFEYDIKSYDDLTKLNLDMKELKELPFQAQITYTSQDGHRMIRFITQTLQTSDNQEAIKKDINSEVINRYVEQTSAKYAIKGLVRESQNKQKEWDDFLENDLMQNAQDESQRETLKSVSKKSKSLRCTLNRKVVQQEKKAKKEEQKYEDIEEEEGVNGDLFDMF